MCKINLATPNESINAVKPKWSDEDVIKIIERGHSWLGGLFPPRDFKIVSTKDNYVPYIITEVKYYLKESKPRRCYVFENLEKGLRSGVNDINTLQFEKADPLLELEPVIIDEKKYNEEILHYCLLDLLVKSYRKYINWNLEVLSINVIFRRKRRVLYQLRGKERCKEIFLDGVILK